MPKKSEDKINLESLLNAYSVKEITNLFAKIDRRFSSLHNKSAEDFMHLNNSFKEIYSLSDEISKKAKEVFELMHSDQNSGLYNVINTIYEKLKVQFEILDYRILVISEQFENLTNQIRHLFFPIKNYSQNLMSLKYLMANLRMSISYSNKDLQIKLEKLYNDSENLINKIKLHADDISGKLNILSKEIKNFQGNFIDYSRYRELDLENLLNDIKSDISIIDKKDKENKTIIPGIKTSIEKLNESNTEIIKKLQYQDIIRQKMEHIQKTHKDLVLELVELSETQEEKHNLNEKVKCFLKIRDISGVQAAQLIQANKEYQSAIEIITNSFILIGDTIKDITFNCEKAYSFGKFNYKNMYEKVSSYIDKSNAYIESYIKQNDGLDKELTRVYNNYIASEDTILRFKDEANILHNYLSELNNDLKNIVKEEPELEKHAIQFSHIVSETNENIQKIENLINPVLTLKKNIEGFVNKTDKSLLGEIDFKGFKDQLKSFKQLGKEIGTLIQNNETKSEVVIEKIRTAISKIKYYQYFEKIIQEIISELNTLNYKLKMNNELNNESKEENLEKLKQYYTVETEHYIHDKISKGEDVDVDFDIDEDDEIEFF